jgi:Outer membrane protein beta-barrel domain
MMIRKTVLTVAVATALTASAAWAQDPRVELSGTAGWTFSDGVNVGAIDDSPIEVGPKDAFSWGARLGFNVSPNIELGFLFASQSTDLEATGLVSRTIPQTVYNYHGYVAYNFGEPDAKARFYVLGGAGATSYGSVAFQVGGFSGETSSETQFSTTWGAGVKLYPGSNFGIKLGARWTPTYIKSDAEGWWCDPYWGCYVVGDAQYSNQFEFSGGIVLRF